MVKMKCSLTIIISAFAVSAVAQSDLSSCNQMCLNNMLGLAPSLGCQPADADCLCKNQNFIYGLRDCSVQACSAVDSAALLAFGTQYCASVGVIVSGVTVPSSTDTVAVTSTTGTAGGSGGAGGSIPISTAAVVTSIATGGSTVLSTVGSTTIYSSGGAGSTRIGGPVAISTAPLVTGIVSSGSTILSTTGSSTVYSSESDATPVSTAAVISNGQTVSYTTIYGAAGGATGGAGNGSSTSVSTVPILSTVTSGSSTFITTIGSSTISSKASGSATSSSSSGLGVQQTAAPIFMAAAGLAALLL